MIRTYKIPNHNAGRQVIFTSVKNDYWWVYEDSHTFRKIIFNNGWFEMFFIVDLVLNIIFLQNIHFKETPANFNDIHFKRNIIDALCS